MIGVKYIDDKKNSFKMSFNVCKMGDYYTAGSTMHVELCVKDTPHARKIGGLLLNLKRKNFHGNVDISLGGRRMIMDLTIWPEMATCFSAFFIATDFDNYLSV